MKRLLFLLVVVAATALFLARGGGEATYTVRPGDTLAGIAARYGTTVSELVALNRDRYSSLADRPDVIEVGWVLRVPGRGDVLAQARARGEQMVAYVDALARTAVAEEPTPTATPAPFSDPVQVAAWRKEVIRLANIERAKVGAPPLVEDPRLNEIAEARVRDMVERHYIGHYDPKTGERLTPTGCGEVIHFRGRVYLLPKHPIQAWMESKAHRAILLSGDCRRAGVTFAHGTFWFNGKEYAGTIAVMILQ